MTLRETFRQPTVPDPLTQVRVLADMFVAGTLAEAGTLARMPLSDAQALLSIGRVELLS